MMLCPVEFSNAAFITFVELLPNLGTPHARYPWDQLQLETHDYDADFDVGGDCLQNIPTHVAHSRTQSHNHIIRI